jgi:septum formation topological specificity factor MinE
MTMFERFRSRRNAARHARDLERALRSANSQAVREEILAIAQRYHG